MHQYQYGDFVFGVNLDYDSVFYCEDFLLAMVVEPDGFPFPRILLLCSRFLNKHHPSCTNEDFIEEVKRIRANPALYSTSAFTDQYKEFVMPPDESESIVPFAPTKEGYENMLYQLAILHPFSGEDSPMEEPLLSFQEFSSRYLPHGFLSTSPKLSL